MKINFNQKLFRLVETDEGLKAQPMFDGGCEMTLRSVSLGSLMIMAGNDQVPAVERAKRYDLALRFIDSDEVDFEAEEIALIKDLIGKMYHPIIVGQVWRLLEGKPSGLESLIKRWKEEQKDQVAPPVAPKVTDEGETEIKN